MIHEGDILLNYISEKAKNIKLFSEGLATSEFGKKPSLPEREFAKSKWNKSYRKYYSLFSRLKHKRAFTNRDLTQLKEVLGEGFERELNQKKEEHFLSLKGESKVEDPKPEYNALRREQERADKYERKYEELLEKHLALQNKYTALLENLKTAN